MAMPPKVLSLYDGWIELGARDIGKWEPERNSAEERDGPGNPPQMDNHLALLAGEIFVREFNSVHDSLLFLNGTCFLAGEIFVVELQPCSLSHSSSPEDMGHQSSTSFQTCPCSIQRRSPFGGGLKRLGCDGK